MCGIAGIVSVDPVQEIQEPLQRMQAALRHRGPDDQGIFMSPDRRVGLAHTRLSIIDLSAAGHQPMATPDGRITIVFNGEIYNFRELRAELQSTGVQFRSNSDTEVILRLYEHHGADCVSHLRGMFAFAIWDSRKRLCLLARDPMGVKPLYFSIQGLGGARRLIFASEIRALLAGGLVGDTIDPDGLLGYLRFGSVPEPLTMIAGVECLPAGTLMTFQEGRIRRSAYWRFPGFDPSEPNKVPTDRVQIVERTRAVLLDSIRAHYVSDVPVGVFLSGGIDSTAVVALSRVVGQRDINTFSISFDVAAYDEGPIAKRTAIAFGTQHRDWKIDRAEAVGLLDGYFDCLDQPTVDGFNTWCVARFASQAGAKVVLSGLGGDELFGGYPTFRLAPIVAKAGKIPRSLRRPLGAMVSAIAYDSQSRRLGEFLQGEGSLQKAWEATRAIFTWSEARKLAEWLLSSPCRGKTDVAYGDDSIESSESTLEIISRLETTRYMRNQLLRDSDVMSMAWGLELRVPFVDSDLSTAMWQLPASERLRPGKRLVIDAVAEIPEWVIGQPKRGFQFPFARWMESEWHDGFSAMVSGTPVRLTRWHQRWLVMSFQRWHDNMRNRRDAAYAQ